MTMMTIMMTVNDDDDDEYKDNKMFRVGIVHVDIDLNSILIIKFDS
jgi:hypothetical protein